MKSIREVSSQGTRGPAYIRFSGEPIAGTEPWKPDSDVIIDYDEAGEVVGIELVALGPEAIDALVDVARRHGLDLSALLAHSFGVSPAA